MSRTKSSPKLFSLTKSVFVLALVGLGTVLGSARPAYAADDDFEFAEALYKRGYLDLAEEKFNELIAKGGSRKAEGEFGLALLKRFSALKEAGQTIERLRAPYEDVMALFEGADAVFAGFIKGNANHTRALDAKLERARLLQQKAEYELKAIEMKWLPEGKDIGAVRKDIAEAYDIAVGLLKPVEDKILKEKQEAEEEHGVSSPEWEEKHHELAVVWLNRLVAIYGKGAALPAGDSKAKAALEQVLGEIEDYLWEYEDRIQGVWALHYSGLANWKLDNDADAFNDLKGAATLANNTDNVAVRKVTFDSYARMAEFAMDVGGEYSSKVLELYERFTKDWPNHSRDAAGQMAALDYARLLWANGRTREALALGQKTLGAANKHGTGLDRVIGAYVGEWINQVGNDEIDIQPEDLRNVYIAKWREEDTAGCIRAARAVIAACKTADQMDLYGWEAWSYVGRCYGIQKRWWACYESFEHIERAWKSDRDNEALTDLTRESTSFGRVKALAALAKQTKNKADEDLRDKLNEDFLENHPDSKDASSGIDRAAAQFMSDGKKLKRAGDMAAAKAKFKQSIDAFKKLMTQSPLKERFEATIADIHRLMGDYVKAIELAESFLTRITAAQPQTTTELRRARARGRVIAIRTILQSHADKAAEARVEKDKDGYKTSSAELLKALDEFEKDFLESVEGGELIVLQWRAEGLLGTDDVEGAEELTSRGMKEFPESGITRYLAANTAVALQRRAYYWSDPARGDLGKFKAMMIRAARLQEFVADTSGVRNPAILTAVARTFQKGADFDKSETLLKEALDLYTTAKDDVRASEVRIQLIDILIDRKKFSEAIPQLESRLVEEEAARAAVVERLKKSTNFTARDLKDLMSKMTRKKEILNAMSRAYLEGKDGTEGTLIAAINLSWILRHHHSKDKRNDAQYIEYTLRLARAWYELGLDFGLPQALDNAILLLNNNIVIAGLVESYEETSPGSEKVITTLLADAKAARSRL